MVKLECECGEIFDSRDPNLSFEEKLDVAREHMEHRIIRKMTTISIQRRIWMALVILVKRTRNYSHVLEILREDGW